MFFKYSNFTRDVSKLVALDTETFLIDEATTWPKVVCLTGYTPGQTHPFICVGDDIKRAMDYLIAEGFTFIWMNAKFDMGVLWNNGILTGEQIFALYDEGRIIDLPTNEKLLNLAEFGGTNTLIMDGFVTTVKRLSLEFLVKSYLGMDITEAKTGADSWRLRYRELHSVPLNEWPPEALKYALDDAKDTFDVCMAQIARSDRLKETMGLDVLQISPAKSAVDFVLGCLTERGNVLDQTKLPEVMAELERLLDPSNFQILYDIGFLTPASDGEPYKDGRKEHREDCIYNPDNPGYIKKAKGGECDCPPKLTNPTAEKRNEKVVKEKVLELAAANPEIELTYTDKGAVQVNASFFEKYGGYYEPLLLLQERDKTKKLKTTYIDHLYYPEGHIHSGSPVSIIRGNYNNLVDTGRTSSYSGKHYPSWNSQNIPNFVRPVILPRPGFVLCSVDVSGMELGTLAQTCINLFGYSRMADLINNGIDLHAYLGAQIAFHTDHWFKLFVEDYHNTNRGTSLQDNTYTMFRCFAKQSDTPVSSDQFTGLWKSKGHEFVPSCADFYKHYRTLAKPTGLGYPGGLGAATFISYARATFGVIVTLEEAKTLKAIWLSTYPEMHQYKKYIEDSCSSSGGYFNYTINTPNGVLHRSKATYCACSNGLGLQSPSAIGATLALWHVTRACYDKSLDSLLYCKNFPTMFIHDEIVSELVDEGAYANTVCVEEIQGIMEKAMQAITPDVKAGTEACLMTRWDKSAYAKKDDNGNLLVWGRDYAV